MDWQTFIAAPLPSPPQKLAPAYLLVQLLDYERAHFLLDKRSPPRLFYERAHIMRITAEAKSETRQRILSAAIDLLMADGWHDTTTRAIAAAAGIATGTLFNYFPTKEAIAADLIAEALQSAAESSSARQGEEPSLEADLFTLVWSGLSNLRTFRKFLGPALETIFSPLARPSPNSAGDTIRVDHLELVEATVASHGFRGALSVVAAQLYWTLYLGVFAFWAADDSPGLEDTLALLDRSLKLFVASLHTDQGGEQ
jgi:AcrR family transcriptional regulator